MILPRPGRTSCPVPALCRRRTVPHVTVLAVVLLLAAGCAKPFPQDLLAKVEKNVTYQAFQDEPEKYDGKLLLFGGEIVDARNLEAGASIIVLQRPLDGECRPSWTAESGGRFLIVSKAFLDLGAFRRGRSITVIGRVDGSQAMPLRGTEYWYPLLVAEQLYLW